MKPKTVSLGLLSLTSLMLFAVRADAQTQPLTGRSNASRAGSQMTSGMFGGSRNSNSSMGSGGAGMNASVTGGGFLQTTQLGQMATFNNQGFIGANNGGFVGRSATGSTVNGQRANRQTGQFRRNGGRNGRNQNGNDGNDNNSNGNRNAAASRLLIRPQHRVAFDYPQPVSTSVGTSLVTRLKTAMESRPEFSGVDVVFDENLGQATLRGSVNSTESAQVAVALVRLEPGVRSVRSELTLSGPQPPSPGLR